MQQLGTNLVNEFEQVHYAMGDACGKFRLYNFKNVNVNTIAYFDNAKSSRCELQFKSIFIS